MKGVTALILVIAFVVFSCNQTSKTETKQTQENITEANAELNEALESKHEGTKAKAIIAWKSFNREADSALANIEGDLKKVAIQIKKANKKDKEKLQANHDITKSNMDTLKERLYKKNVEFENDLQRFDDKIFEKNQSFKREFKHDMDRLVKLLKGLFKDDVK